MRIIRHRTAAFGVGGLFVVACVGSGSSTMSGTPVNEPLRALSIIPATSKACPGEVIATRYEATTASGRRIALTGANLQLIERSGTAVTTRGDGSWVADVNPLVSAATGFRLRAALKGDSTIRADTVVVPRYGCGRSAIPLLSAYLRLGVFRSPFYDSIVVAAVETRGGTAQIIVLGPDEMKAGAIRVDASGKDGRPGQRGRNGVNGASCEAGQPGEDGGDGAPGTDGGRVDLIVQADAKWLENLVSVANPGGHGGSGGPGGAGGQAGPRGQSTGGTGRGSSCSTSPGRPGNPGRAGANGTPGPRPQLSTIPFPLLWTGSLLWTNQDFRTALEQLIELTQR